MARILIIEDNPTNLELIVYLLKSFGHVPLQAVTGEAGIEIAQREVPELILCDMQLPRMNGYEVAHYLKSDPVLRTIPIVAVTAFAMVGDRDRVLAAGFDGYIAKPILPDQFVDQVEGYLLFKQHPTLPHTHMQRGKTKPLPRKFITILIVDDIALNLLLLHSILELFGYTVLMAHNVKEALNLAHNSLPELIMTDLQMPDQNGWDLLKAVKADPILKKIKVIVHSASTASQKEIDLARALGAVKFISRPIEPEALLEEIENCLFNIKD